MLIYAGLKTRQPTESVILCVTWYQHARLSCFLRHDVDTPLIEEPMHSDATCKANLKMVLQNQKLATSNAKSVLSWWRW